MTWFCMLLNFDSGWGALLGGAYNTRKLGSPNCHPRLNFHVQLTALVTLFHLKVSCMALKLVFSGLLSFTMGMDD